MVLKFFALSFFICYAIVSDSGSTVAANKPDPKEKSATPKSVYYYDGSRCKNLDENERSSFNGKTYESRSKCLAKHPDRNKTRKKARSQVNRKRAQVQKQRPTRVRSPTKSAGIPAKSSNPKPAEQFRRKVQASSKQSASGRASHKQKTTNKNRRKKVRVHPKTNTRKKSASNQSPNVNPFSATRPGAAPGYGTKPKTTSGKKVRRRGGGSKSAAGKNKKSSPPVNPHVMLNGGQPSVDNINAKNGQKIRNHKMKPGTKRLVKKRKLKSGKLLNFNHTSSSPQNQTSRSNTAPKVRIDESGRRLVYEPRATGEDGSCYWISRHTDGKQIIKSAEHWSKCYKYEYADPRKTTCRKVVIVPGGQSSATPETVPLKKCRKKRAGRRRVRIKGASSAAAAAADKIANKTSTVVKPGQNSGNVMLGDQPNRNQTVDETSNQHGQQGQNQPVETNSQQGQQGQQGQNEPVVETSGQPDQQESPTASTETKFKYDVETKTCVPVTVPVNVKGGLRTKANQSKHKLGKNPGRNGRPPTRRTIRTPRKLRRKVASNGKKVRVRKVRVKKPTTAEQSRRTRNKRDATKNRRNKNVRKRARTSGQQRVSNVGRRRKSFRRKSAVDAEPKLYDSPEECQAENKPQGDEPTATETGTNGINNATTASTAQNSKNGANSVTATEGESSPTTARTTTKQGPEEIGGPIACKKRCWDKNDDFSYCIEVTEEECTKYKSNCFRLPRKERQKKLDGTKPATHFIYHYKSYGWWYYYEVSEDECMTVGEKTCAPCSEYDVYGKYYIDGINEEPRSSKAPKTSKKPTSASQPEMVTQPMTQALVNNANPATSAPKLPGRPDQPTAVDPDPPTEAPEEPEVPTEAPTAVPTEQPVSEPDEPVPVTSAAKSPTAKIEIKFKYDEATKTCVSVQVTVNGGGALRTKAHRGQSKLILGENPLRNGRPPIRRTVHTPRNFRRKVASNGKKVRVRKVRVKKPAAVEKSRTRNKRDTKSRRVYVRQRARTSGQKRVSNTGRRRKSFRWKSNAEPKLYSSTEECEAENKPQNVSAPGPGTNGINNTITGRTGQTINNGTNNATAPDVLVDVKCAQDCLTKKNRCWKTNICGTGDAPACEKMPASEADKLAPRTSDNVFIECKAGEDNDCGIKFCTGWDDRKCYTCLKNDADYYLKKYANNYEIKCQKNCFRETARICKDALGCESHNDLLTCHWVNKERYDRELEKVPQNLWKIKCNNDGTGCKETDYCFDGDYCTVCDDRKTVDEIISRGQVHPKVASPNGNGSMVGIAPGRNGNNTENVRFTIQDGKCVQVEVMQGDSPQRPRRYNRTKYPHVRFRRKKHGRKKNSKKVYKQRQRRKNRRRQKRQANQPPTFTNEPDCQKYLNATKLPTNCPDGQKHNEDGICEANCPNDNYVWKPELNKCVDDYGCSPEEEYYSFDKECFPRCGENQTLNEDNECEDCPQGTIPNDENDCVAPEKPDVEKPGTEKPVVPPPKEPEKQHKIVNGVCVPVGSAAANAEMMQSDQSPPVKSRKVPVRKSNKKRAPPKRRRRRRKGNSKVVRIRNKRQAANDSQIFISKQQCQEHLKTIVPPPKEPEKQHKIVNGVCVPVANAEMMQNDYSPPVKSSIQQKVPVRNSHNKKAQPNKKRRRRRKGNSKGVRVRNKRQATTGSEIFTSKQKCEDHLKTIKPCPAGRKQGADGSCTLDCPEGQMEDPNTKKCIAVPDCLEDHNWDPKRKQCVDKHGCTQKEDYIEGAKKCLPLCYVNQIRNKDYECEACPEGTSPTDENICWPDGVEEKVCSIMYGGREVCVTIGDVSACETKHTLGELVSQKFNPFKAYDALIYAWNKNKDIPIGEIIDGFGSVSNSVFSAPKKDLHLLNRFFRLVMRTEDDCEYLNRQGVKIHELRNCEFAECANDNEDGDDGDEGDDDEDE